MSFTYSIVIPSWKGIQLLKKNLPAVLQLPAKEVIIIDDFSPDNDIQFIQNNFPQVITARNEKNYGFGTTVNRGVSRATGDIVILLNLDAKPASDICRYLDQDFQDETVFAVSLAEQEFGPTRMIFQDGYLAHDSITPVPTKISPTFWVSGGSGAFRRDLWNKLGGLDAVYDPFYWEDIDICMRASQAGYLNLWDPRAHVEHYHESTIGKHIKSDFKIRIQERNHLIFTWKYLSMTQWPIHLFHLCVRLLKTPGYIRVVIMAILRLAKKSK